MMGKRQRGAFQTRLLHSPAPWGGGSPTFPSMKSTKLLISPLDKFKGMWPGSLVGALAP